MAMTSGSNGMAAVKVEVLLAIGRIQPHTAACLRHHRHFLVGRDLETVFQRDNIVNLFSDLCTQLVTSPSSLNNPSGESAGAYAIRYASLRLGQRGPDTIGVTDIEQHPF